MTAREEYKIRRRGSLVLANSTVYDASLSYTALGILAVLLARPDDAPKGYRTLMRPAANVGQASILSAFRELREQGYRYQFYRTETTAKGNRVFTCTYIYETPVSLEMAKRDHFQETGCQPIEVVKKRKSKDTLASVPDAQDPDAHVPDAHVPDAQRLGSAAVGFSPSPKVEEINQREASETPQKEAEKAPVKPYVGITLEQMELNRQGAAKARAALRAKEAQQ